MGSTGRRAAMGYIDFAVFFLAAFLRPPFFLVPFFFVPFLAPFFAAFFLATVIPPYREPTMTASAAGLPGSYSAKRVTTPLNRRLSTMTGDASREAFESSMAIHIAVSFDRIVCITQLA